MLGTYQEIGIGACQKKRKKRQKNYGHEHRLFFASDDRIQKFLTQKEVQIKMSSVMPFTFNAVELCIATINEKPWTRAREACRALECKKGRARDVLKKHVSIENKQHKHDLEGRAATACPLEWPKNSQPNDYYISEEGMYELLFSS